MAISPADETAATALVAFLANRLPALGRRIGTPIVAALTADSNTVAGTLTPDAAGARDHSVTTAGALARLATEARALAAGVDGDLTITTGATALTVAATLTVATPLPGPALLFAFDPATDGTLDAWTGCSDPTRFPVVGGAVAVAGGYAEAGVRGKLWRHVADTPPTSGVFSVRATVTLAGLPTPDAPVPKLKPLAIDDPDGNEDLVALLFEGLQGGGYGWTLHLYSRDYATVLVANLSADLVVGANVVELVYDTTGATPVGSCYLGGALVAQLTDPYTGDPDPGLVWGGGELWVYDFYHPYGLDAVSVADGVQGV
jgi:hypothetical protein